MDLGDEKSEDNAKYSFLLGAALRNDDPDQFMNIYDDILPKDIRPDEVERVKGTARHIASLPEDQFNELVAQARDFSLVFTPRSSTMTDQSKALCSLAYSSQVSVATTVSSGQTVIKYMELEDMKKQSHVDQAPVDDDCDSGVCNSSKNTCSLSDDNDLTDDSERAGVINYFNTSSNEKLLRSSTSFGSSDKSHISQQHNAAYDESFDSPLESSPHEPHSPKSEEESDYLASRSKFMECHSNALAHRQKDFHVDNSYSWQIREQNEELQKKNNMIYDEVQAVQSDDGDDLTEIKIDSQKDIGSSCRDEVDIETVNVGPRFTRQEHDFEHGMTRGSEAHHLRRDGPLSFNNFHMRQTPPEKTLSFPLTYTQVSNAATRTVSSSSISTPRSSMGSYARSAEPAEGLIDFSRSTQYGMVKDGSAQAASLFDPAGNSSDEALADRNKKKKTKKSKQDETAKDINGNPVREDSPPASSSSSASSSCAPSFLSSFSGSKYSFSSDLSQKVSAASSQDMNLGDLHGNNKSTSRKKKKKAKEDHEIKAEEIPGHKGNLDVSDLLNFIAGNPYNNKENDKMANSKAKKKKPTKTCATVTGVVKEETKFSVGNNRSENKNNSTVLTGVNQLPPQETSYAIDEKAVKPGKQTAEVNAAFVLSSQSGTLDSQNESAAISSLTCDLNDMCKPSDLCVSNDHRTLVGSSSVEGTCQPHRHPDVNLNLVDTMPPVIDGPQVKTANILAENELLPLLSDVSTSRMKRKKLQKNAFVNSKEEGRNSGVVSGYGSLDTDRRLSSSSEKTTPPSSAASDCSHSEDINSYARDYSDASQGGDTISEANSLLSKVKTGAVDKYNSNSSRSPKHKLSAGTRTSNLVGGNDKYIFTDFDVVPPPSEGEFTIVSTRRKKKRNPPLQAQRPSDRLRPQVYNTNNRPPISMDINPILAPPAPVPRDTSSERAFSPSGFPVLGREGRRNSTGTVPTTALLDESDSESVKSLPAAGNPVPAKKDSYAKIVAGSKTGEMVESMCEKNEEASIDNLPTNDLAVCDEGTGLKTNVVLEVCENPPPTKPENNNISQDIQSSVAVMATPVSQKVVTNSEEVSDSCQASVSIPTSKPTNANPMTTVVSNCPTKSSGATSTSSKPDTVSGQINSEAVLEEHTESEKTDFETEPTISSASTHTKESSSVNVAKFPSHSELVDVKVSAKNHGVQISTTPLKTTFAPSNVQKHLPKTKSVKTRQQNKSVIFLDRHFNEPSPALGITFGFEPELEEAGGDVKKNDSAPPVPDLTTPPEENCSSADINKPQPSTKSPSSDSVTLSAAAACTSVKTASLPNGLVIPPQGAPSSLSPKAVPAPSFSPVASRLATPPPRELDANFQPGFFNHFDCVGYVFSNWEDVQNRLKKKPCRVVMFSAE